MSPTHCDSCEAMTVNTISGILVLMGLQQIFCPSLCWKMGCYPSSTPSHPQWTLTIQCFGATLLGWGMTLYDKNLAPQALMAHGATILGCILRDGKSFSLPHIFGLGHLFAGAWLYHNKK